MKKTADEGNSTEQTYLAFKSISVIAGNYMRVPWNWPWSVMQETTEQSWDSFPPLCLWHHYLTIGQNKILVGKKWSLTAPTVEDSRSSHVPNLLSSLKLGREERSKSSNLSSGEYFTSSHSPAIPKSQREIIWTSAPLHMSSFSCTRRY